MFCHKDSCSDDGRFYCDSCGYVYCELHFDFSMAACDNCSMVKADILEIE